MSTMQTRAVEEFDFMRMLMEQAKRAREKADETGRRAASKPFVPKLTVGG